MRYIVDIPKRLDVRIRKILDGKNFDYTSMDEFVNVALENQLKIEDGETSKSIMKVGTSPMKEVQPQFSNVLRLIKDVEVPTVDIPSSVKSQTVVLWGQINRILPIKLGARFLANMIRESGTEYIDLEDFRENAADVARDFGLNLKDLDERNRRKPGRKFSTGLPIGSKVDLSKNRYKAHYLGYQTGKGYLGGALADLKLADIEDDKIGITEKGLAFANLENPLLDSDSPNPAEVLSKDEINLYLSLVEEMLPEESKFMKQVLGMIKDGEPPRDEFNEKVKKVLQRLWPNSKITPAMANTMRSGVLSRMWELGLVESKRLGRTVVYSITKKGRAYLNKG